MSDRLKVRLAKEKDDKKKMVEKLKECKSLLTETKEKFRKWRHRHPHAKETTAYGEGSASVRGHAMLEVLADWALQHDSTSEVHAETVENKIATNNTQRISLLAYKYIYIYCLHSMYPIHVLFLCSFCFILPFNFASPGGFLKSREQITGSKTIRTTQSPKQRKATQSNAKQSTPSKTTKPTHMQRDNANTKQHNSVTQV